MYNIVGFPFYKSVLEACHKGIRVHTIQMHGKEFPDRLQSECVAARYEKLSEIEVFFSSENRYSKVYQ